MRFDGSNTAFVTYQPLLWQTLRQMMPKGMMLRGFLSNSSLVDLRPGDLLFFSEEGAMGNAIKASTGQYTHVAMVESLGQRDTVWIIDATQKHGVSRRPYIFRLNNHPDVYRPNPGSPFYADDAIRRARSFIGQPYDNAFLPDNGALYCSELIYECYRHISDDETHLFKAKPMNWRDKDGRLPKYWKKHFKKLKMEVPEGVSGTNPTDMSKSPLLYKVF